VPGAGWLAYPRLMRFAAFLALIGIAVAPLRAQSAQAFTLAQALSAPYSTDLKPAPNGGLFAWVEHVDGRNNLFVGGRDQPARELTHNAVDDAQDISQLAWSADGSALAYTLGAETGAAGKPANPAHLQRATPLEVWVVAANGESTPLQVGEGQRPLFEPLNHRLLFLREGKVWSADVDIRCLSEGGGCSPAIPPAAIHQLIFDRGAASDLTLSPDGSKLAFISRRREDNEPAHALLALYNLLTRTLTFPAPSTGRDSAPVFSPDGKSLAWLRAPFTPVPEFAANRISANPWSIQKLDLATGQARTLFTPAANLRGSVLPHLASGEPRLFFPANDALDFFSEADGWVHLYEIDPNADVNVSEVKWMTPGPAEVDDVVFSKNHHSLFFSSNQVATNSKDARDQDRRHLWHIDLTQPNILPTELTFGEGIETHPELSADGTIAALISDARTPMHPALIARDGAMSAVDPAMLPASYPGTTFVVPQQVLFLSTPMASDGSRKPGTPKAARATPLTIHGQLFLPPVVATGKRAAILYVHGGPNRQMLLGYPGMDYYSNAYAMNEYLASRGFIVLSINYRCGIGYGIDFRQCLHAGPTGADEYNDVLAAAKYLRSRPDVDPKRIGIWGGSYGGYLTALALARNSNLFAAGVDFHGVHNWNLEDNASDWRTGSNAQRDALAARALASSPLGDVSHWTSPILLIHGDDDPDVAYAQTPALAEALRARNATLSVGVRVDVEELIFPDEVHGFLLHRDWLTAYTAAAAFFERTLKP
jgi:dipeptidyl aminopeptidase/acylaminoacyl peptidase